MSNEAYADLLLFVICGGVAAVFTKLIFDFKYEFDQWRSK